MHPIVERLRSEFLEMPGLRLTMTQIRRFCGLDASACSSAVDMLIEEKFLCAKPDGTYARLTDGELTRPRATKAALGSPIFHRRAS